MDGMCCVCAQTGHLPLFKRLEVAWVGAGQGFEPNHLLDRKGSTTLWPWSKSPSSLGLLKEDEIRLLGKVGGNEC